MNSEVTQLNLWKARVKNFLRGDFLRAKKLTVNAELAYVIAKRYGKRNLYFFTENKKQFKADISFLNRFKLLPKIEFITKDKNICDSVVLCDVNDQVVKNKIRELYNNNNVIIYIDEEIPDIDFIFCGLTVDGKRVTIFDKQATDNIKNIDNNCGNLDSRLRENDRNGKVERDCHVVPPCKDDDDRLKIQAIVTCYNEADIIGHTIKYLIEQGIYVHVINNWSTDNSDEIVDEFVNKSEFVTSEKFPMDGPSKTYDWGNILGRIQEIAMKNSNKFDWFVHHDADEVREAPFKDVKSLKKGIEIVDSCGFNAIDHVVLNFVPIPNDYDGYQNIVKYLKYCSFGNQYGDLKQVKAWKSCDTIDLVSSSGHHVDFADREEKVFPYKFLLRHYSLRSQQQAEQKIFKDRKPRWNKQEQKKQWHTHYNHINKAQDLKWDKKDYLYFERKKFYDKYLIQMITSIGINIEDVKVNK